MQRGRHWPWWLAAAAIGGGAIALLWPGVVTYDGLSQYHQAVSGRYDDWHPPVVARLWSAWRALRIDGSGPMLATQLALFWSGIGLIAGALGAAGRGRAAAAAIAAGLFPIPLDWLAAVLKDGQMLGALTFACGLVAHWRLAGRRLPAGAAVAVAAALAYALLARANAVFAVAPLALGLAGWGGARRLPARIALLAATTLGLIAVSGPMNHRLLGAEPSHVERTLAVFDMAGIAHRVPLATLPDLPPPVWAAAERTRCYTPLYWDNLGDLTKCGRIASSLAFNRADGLPSIWGEWAGLVARHPLAYAAHRLAHLDATLRLAGDAHAGRATAPNASLADSSWIGQPPRAAKARLQPLAAWTATTPLGSPGWWLVLACGLWWTLAGCPPQPARALGLAIASSACLMTASFAVASIASDLRYHLWLMTGTLLAASLLAACEGVPRRRLTLALAVATIAGCVSIALRG